MKKMKDFKLLASLFGSGAVILSAAIYFGPANATVDECKDGVQPSYTVTGELYGDNNSDGKLSGTECDWR